MTIGDFEDCVEGYSARIDEQVEIQNVLNHILGAYIRTAFHDPKHYPKKAHRMSRKAETASSSKISSDAEFEAYIAAQIEKGN